MNWSAHVNLIPRWRGDLFFVSDKDMNGEILVPRVPRNYLTENGHEDNSTPRVCFTPSVEQCLMSLGRNLYGEVLFVHKIPKTEQFNVWKPDVVAVPDSIITDELWVRGNVRIMKVGAIRVTGHPDDMAANYTCGPDIATLYRWEYVWLTPTRTPPHTQE